MAVVVLHTTFGDITLELNAEKAPKTVANFLTYVESGFFNGLLFHRVIDGFMIQGGGLESGMEEKDGGFAPIENEADNGLSNDKGTIAMARTMEPHSASSQFFINVQDNLFLNHTAKTRDGWGYCVFGKVTDGMDVVAKIQKVETTHRRGHQDVPVDDVVINSAEIISA